MDMGFVLLCAQSGRWRELVICRSAHDTPFHLQAILPASVCPENSYQIKGVGARHRSSMMYLSTLTQLTNI
jgi:hypothetical protein